MAKANLDPEHVTALVDKWRDLLGVGPEWTIGIKVIGSREEVDEDEREDFALTRVEEAYFTADIQFHAWMFDSKDDEYLDLVACHEVVHIVTHKLETLAEASLGARHEVLCTILTENVVERVSRALVRLARSGK